MFKPGAPITKDWILERASQEEIMRFYVGKKFRIGTAFNSPFRKDERPSCVVYAFPDGGIILKDLAEGWKGDWISVATKATGVTFPAILKRIADDLDLYSRSANLDPPRIDTGIILPRRPIMLPAVSQYRPEDARYLAQYGISREVAVRYGTYSLEALEGENGRLIYARTDETPAIVYLFPDGIKVYFYNRPKVGTKPRFLNTSRYIGGWDQLPISGQGVVITKAMKDVLVFATLGVPAICLQSEGETPSSEVIEVLKRRFTNVFCLMDNDRAGKRATIRIRRLGVTPLLIPEAWGVKDISDLSQKYGIKAIGRLISTIATSYDIQYESPLD